jgi:magnesium transporter
VAKSPSDVAIATAEVLPVEEASNGHEAPLGEGTIRLLVLETGRLRQWEGEAALTELPRAIGRRAARLWIDVARGSVELKTRVGTILGMHPLLIEDITERDQRAKLEQVDDLLHLVLFCLGFDDGQIYERELDFVLGRRFLLTSHSEWWDPMTTRHLLRVGPADMMGRGLDHLVWALADDVIDGYFPILDELGDEIDALEDRVVASADRRLLERLFELKRAVIQVRRVTSPEREMFNILSSREGTLISEPERLYYRDAYDHLIRLTDELDTYRELASAALEAYLSTVNNNLSLIMKRLTGVTVVVAGIGALAGIFGMSEAQAAFRLDEGPGFWIITFGCLFLAALAVWLLRRIDWI